MSDKVRSALIDIALVLNALAVLMVASWLAWTRTVTAPTVAGLLSSGSLIVILLYLRRRRAAREATGIEARRW